MTTDVPRSGSWRAIESKLTFAGEVTILTVTGNVELGNTNELPYLLEATSQGTNPTELILDLHIATYGVGAAVQHWKGVHYVRVVDPGDFRSVLIRCGDEVIGKAGVEVVLS